MHCPERWGFVYFSSAQSPESAEKLALEEASRQETVAREALMGWHYLLQDWAAAHSEACDPPEVPDAPFTPLPPTLDELQLGAVDPLTSEALESSQGEGFGYGLEERPDLPGGYMAYVCLGAQARGSRLCVDGDAHIWHERVDDVRLGEP